MNLSYSQASGGDSREASKFGMLKKRVGKVFLAFLMLVLAVPTLVGTMSFVGAQSAYAEEVRPDESEKEGVDLDADGDGSAEDEEGGVLDTIEENVIEPVETNCSNGGGAQSLGWIACPIMTWAGEATEKIYNDFVAKSLRVEPQLFTGADSNVLSGWQTFQGIANTIFAILFLFVIFSQLTGVGIDNYGIKKILPKLIVTAILINLSYFVCLLCVDLSNILGNGLQMLFDALGSNLHPEVSVADSSLSTAKEVLATGGSLAGLGVLGLLVTMTGAIWGGPEIALALLIAAIGVLVSIFFLFVLLAARQAAVVVLIVISPVAVVCYALPNTKKMFDKWVKFFEGMLLLYPICGLLVGGGNYVSSLLLTAGLGNGFFTALTAMLTGIIPIFFIPTVLKNSFAAMGSLGGRIAGFGDRMRNRAQNGVANSQAYKNAQDRANKFATRKNMEMDKKLYDKDGNFIGGRMARARRFLRGGEHGIATTRAQYIKDQAELSAQENLMGSGFERALAGIEADADAKNVANAAAMISYGKVGMNGLAASETNPAVNADDASSVGAYHAAALERYRNATDERARASALAEIKGAQELLTKTDKGRAEMQTNFENALRAGNTEGLGAAASHALSNAGDKIKSANRGEHSMLTDLATNNLADPVNLSKLQAKLDQVDANGNVVKRGEYSMAGTDKYTPESLANADDGAIERLATSIESGSMSGTPELDQARETLQATAYEALQKKQAGTLDIKPEVERQIQRILGSNYTPKATPNSQARIIGHGAYEDPAGNVYHLRQMDNGKFLDDNGFEVDITHFKQR